MTPDLPRPVRPAPRWRAMGGWVEYPKFTHPSFEFEHLPVFNVLGPKGFYEGFRPSPEVSELSRLPSPVPHFHGPRPGFAGTLRSLTL